MSTLHAPASVFPFQTPARPSSLFTPTAGCTTFTPSDPTEHPDYDAAFEAELNAHYDAIACDVTEEELIAMHREQVARAAAEIEAAPRQPVTAAEAAAWWNAA